MERSQRKGCARGVGQAPSGRAAEGMTTTPIDGVSRGTAARIRVGRDVVGGATIAATLVASARIRSPRTRRLCWCEGTHVGRGLLMVSTEERRLPTVGRQVQGEAAGRYNVEQDSPASAGTAQQRRMPGRGGVDEHSDGPVVAGSGRRVEGALTSPQRASRSLLIRAVGVSRGMSQTGWRPACVWRGGVSGLTVRWGVADGRGASPGLSGGGPHG